MLVQLMEYCTSSAGLTWLILGSDLAIVVAYFAIPFIMLVVLRDRKDDIPYPWLWTLFVTFIVACGLTHVVHIMSALTGVAYLGLAAAIGAVTALASVGTAIAFSILLPQIKLLPSPEQQRWQLEKLVAERTSEKDALIREINHRVGNQLQILSSLVSIESRRAVTPEVADVLGRIRAQLVNMGEQHRTLSGRDYMAAQKISFTSLPFPPAGAVEQPAE
jgi:hypothetical protein